MPGGYDNNAAGELSFAAGFKSYARYAGSFVWSDYSSSGTLLESTAANQFLARATGGFTFWTNAANSVGATLAPGSGTWASASDRNLKTDVARIDDASLVLATVRAEQVGSVLSRGPWVARDPTPLHVVVPVQYSPILPQTPK